MIQCWFKFAAKIFHYKTITSKCLLTWMYLLQVYYRLYSERHLSIHSHALYHIFLTWNDMHNSNYLTIKLQLYDNSDWVPKEPLEEYLWSDVAGIQSPTNSLGSPSPPVTQITMVDSHSILVCAENQRNHQWGCILRQHFVVFTLNHAFHSIFINTNLVRYVNYNKIVWYRVDINQPRISILLR